MDPILEEIQQFTSATAEQLQALNEQLRTERGFREALERKLNMARVPAPVRSTHLDGASERDVFVLQCKNRYPDRAHLADALDDETYESYRVGFRKYLRFGERLFSAEEQKTMIVGSDPDGGYLAPSAFYGQIIQTEQLNAVMRQVARTLPIGLGSLDIPAATQLPTAAWVGEVSARNATATAPMAKLEIFVKEIYAEPEVSQKLLDDSVFDIEMFLAEQIGLAFAIAEDAAFISGVGVVTPQGFLTAPTSATGDLVTSNPRPFGALQYTPSGVAGAWPATDAACLDFLNAIVFSLKPAYRRNATWVMPTSVLLRVSQMKSTTGFPIWQPSASAGAPSMLLGYPLREAEQMPVVAANSYSIAFGDWQRGYWIVDRFGVRTLRDPFTNKPYVRFYTTKRMGGQVTDSLAIKLGKFAAS